MSILLSDAPLSREVAYAAQQELAAAEFAFESGEAMGQPTRCLAAFEIEFSLRAEQVDDMSTDECEERFGYTPAQIQANRQHLVEVRRSALAEVEALLPAPGDDRQALKRQAWLEQATKLNGQELIMYEIHRRLSDPTLSDQLSIDDLILSNPDISEETIEYRFGNQPYGDGYYDAPNTFEVRTMPAKPTVAELRRERFMETAKAVAAKYGVVFEYGAEQLNLSFWQLDDDTGKLSPMHDLSVESVEDGRRAHNALLLAAGVLLGKAAVSPGAHSIDAMHDYGPAMTHRAGPDKLGQVRVLPDRIEVRHEIGRHGSSTLALLGSLAGALYGVRHPEEMSAIAHIASERIFVTHEDFDREEYLPLHFGIRRSAISPEDFIIPDVEYLRRPGRAARILRSIFGNEVQDTESVREMAGELLSIISVSPEGTLQYDQDAFRAISRRYPELAGSTGESRLREALRGLGVRAAPVVHAEVLLPNLSMVNMHDRLRDFVESPVLRSLISTKLLESVAEERGRAFTHEQAVAEYFAMFTLLDRGLNEYAGRPAQLSRYWLSQLDQLVIEFSRADQEKLRSIIVQWAEVLLNMYEQGEAGNRLPQSRERPGALQRFISHLNSL